MKVKKTAIILLIVALLIILIGAFIPFVLLNFSSSSVCNCNYSNVCGRVYPYDMSFYLENEGWMDFGKAMPIVYEIAVVNKVALGGA